MSLDHDRAIARRLALEGRFGADALALNASLIARDPSDLDARTRLARCYREAGRPTDAEAEYREVLSRDPKNRIAASGLASLQEPPPTPPAPRAARQPRTVRTEPRPGPAASAGPVPRTFTGFKPADFSELGGCAERDIPRTFGPRVVDLVRRVNALPSSREHAAIRDPVQRHLFRTGLHDVHARPRQWYVFNQSARWEPQFHLGMRGGEVGRSWLRVGLGLDLSLSGRDPAAAEGREHARNALRRLQALLASDRRHLLTAWMVREGGLIECDWSGPRLDLRDPVRAAALVAGVDGVRTEWVFLGKWLFPAEPGDAAVLADPVALVRTIERAFLGLAPAFRALVA